MKRIIKILLVINLAVISLLIFSSCQDATISPYEQPISKPIILNDYPLEIGNYWKYTVSYPGENTIDTFLVSIKSKNTKNIFDTTLYEYLFTEKYSTNSVSHQEQYNGRIFNYKNNIYITQNNRLTTNKPQFVRIIQDTMFNGLIWVDTLYKDMQGLPAIVELRKVEAKLDTTFNNIKFRNCYLTSRNWIYHSQGRIDTVKIGTEIFCPTVGIIYQDESVDNEVYEKRVIYDYMISIRQ